MQYDDDAEKYGYEGEMTLLKCDELKAINAYQLITNTEDSDVYIHNDEFGCGGNLVECYLKSEVDAAIAELKDVIHELQVDLEGTKATAYADSVDAEMRERRLNHALYKACANWALAEIECEQLDSQMFAFGMTSDKEVAWKKVERKCLKKVELYK
jgi:hypothetical protein